MVQDKNNSLQHFSKKTQRMEWLQEKIRKYEVKRLVKKGRKYQKRTTSEPSFFPPFCTVSYISNVKCMDFLKASASHSSNY